MKYLVFSHGFGVKKDSRGMFTDIAKAFPGYKSILFDYNDVDEATNTLTVRSLHEQAKILQTKINELLKEDPEAEITLVCHSQGCVSAALANPKDIKQAILLTPPGKVSATRTEEFFGKRPGASKEQDGTMRVPRADGSTTRITREFLEDLTTIDPLEEYTKLADQTPTTIVIANQDEVLRGLVGLSLLPKSGTILHIDGDHNFTGDSRAGLIETLKPLIG